MIPIVSIDLHISDKEIIKIYKRKWDIELNYKELKKHFGFRNEDLVSIIAMLQNVTQKMLGFRYES